MRRKEDQEPGVPKRGRQERAHHVLTHMPFRSSWKHCVGGRGKEAGHCRKTEERTEEALPEVQLDNAFPSSECGGEGVTVLVARETVASMSMATAVPNKKTAREFAITILAAFLKKLSPERRDQTDREANPEEALSAVVTYLFAMEGRSKDGGRAHSRGGLGEQRDSRWSDPDRRGTGESPEVRTRRKTESADSGWPHNTGSWNLQLRL